MDARRALRGRPGRVQGNTRPAVGKRVEHPREVLAGAGAHVDDAARSPGGGRPCGLGEPVTTSSKPAASTRSLAETIAAVSAVRV